MDHNFKPGDKVVCKNGARPFLNDWYTIANCDGMGGVFLVEYPGTQFYASCFKPYVDQPSSPIQTRTVSELVPGIYGRVEVAATFDKIIVMGLTDEGGECFSLENLSAKELRSAAATFLELANYLEEKG